MDDSFFEAWRGDRIYYTEHSTSKVKAQAPKLPVLSCQLYVNLSYSRFRRVSVLQLPG